MQPGDAANHGIEPPFFDSEPDGFAVFGGPDLSAEYVDPAIRMLLPDITGDLARSEAEDSRRVAAVAAQVLETGIAALVRGLPAATGMTVDLMLKRIDAEGGRRVLALARIVPSVSGAVSYPKPPPTPAGPRFERVETAPTAEPPSMPLVTPPSQPPPPPRAPAPPTGEPPVPVEVGAYSSRSSAGADEASRAPLSREAVLAAEPISRTPAAAAPQSLSATLEHIGIALQTSMDAEAGLDRALRDAAIALGSSTASVMLRRNRTSVVEITYGLPAEYRGLRFRDDQEPHGRMANAAGEVVVIEDASSDDRVRGARLRSGEILAILAVPLMCANERIGVVYFNWATPQRFSAEQRQFVRSLSSVLAPHAQVLRLMRVADREATYVATLLDTIRAVCDEGLRSSIAAAVLEVLHDRLGLDYGDIRIGASQYALRMLATLHGHETLPTNGAPSELGQQAVFENRMITGRTEEVPEGRDLDGIRHISVPFEVGDELVGVMDLSFLGSRRFTPDEMELFSAVGRLLSLALYCGEEIGSRDSSADDAEPQG